VAHNRPILDAMIDWPSARAAFDRDGVVLLPQVLSPDDLAAALEAWRWSLEHPALGGKVAQADAGATFYQDLYNPRVLEGYRAMLEASPLPALCARLWDTDSVWFMYEQVFLKEGGETRRTPWHQDASYLPIGGRDTAVAWITFDPVAAEDALEFVPGSHRGVLYNGSSFALGDDTAPLYPVSDMPRLPDIEARRGEFEIVSWPVTPGDVIIFDVATLHGGAATHGASRRRTLTLRFFGERATYAPKVGRGGLPNVPGLGQRLAPGDPFRDEAFLKLWPKPGAGT
jgi:ectoine hydroxylase-related dioxygenase (phytanoyl-CoA dioxygenase family)